MKLKSLILVYIVVASVMILGTGLSVLTFFQPFQITAEDSKSLSNQQSIFFLETSSSPAALSLAAPSFTLPSTTGGKISLSDYEGKTNVLLYFQEGIMCAPCWKQIEDIQKEYDKFKSLDIELLTITVDPLNALIKESNKREITLPVLDDGDLSVSKAYNVLEHSMHPDSRPGHSFVLIGKDGNVIWKKHYYASVEEGGMVMNGMNMDMAGRMYVPVDELIGELDKVSYLLLPQSTFKSSSSFSSSNTTSRLLTKTNGSDYGPQKQPSDQAMLPLNSNNTVAMVDHSMCLTPIHRHADLKIYLNGDLLNLTERKYMDQSGEVHFHPTVKVNPNDTPGIPFGDMVHIHKENVTIGDFLNTLELDNASINTPQNIKNLKVYINSKVNPEGLHYIMHDKDRILVTDMSSGNTGEIAKQIESVTSYAVIGKDKNPSLFGGC